MNFHCFSKYKYDLDALFENITKKTSSLILSPIRMKKNRILKNDAYKLKLRPCDALFISVSAQIQRTVNSEIFSSVFFSRNFAYEFSENKTFAKWRKPFFLY